MRLHYLRCSLCEFWGTGQDHIHIEATISGTQSISHFDSESTEVESIVLQQGEIIYKYFSSKNDIHLIRGSQTIGSIAHCMCESCLLETLATPFPHYGDGAYGTLHKGLKDQGVAEEVIQAHGINIWAMDYRVKLRVLNDISLKKIARTGGVIRSVPTMALRRNEIVLADKGDIEIIGFEQWDGTSWVDSLV